MVWRMRLSCEARAPAALRPYLAACPAEWLRALVGPQGGELVRLWPELARQLPGLPAPTHGGPEAERYLLATWAPETRPASLALDAPGAGPDEDLDWLRLDIEETSGGGPFDQAGTVRFTAHFRTPAGRRTQQETSRFVRREGTWLYYDGDVS